MGGEEGWYTDPFGRHEARWMSAGVPTKLVRDNGVEAYDDPPDEPPMQAAERIVTEGAANGGDLRRADDAERGSLYSGKSAIRKGLDIVLDQGPIF